MQTLYNVDASGSQRLWALAKAVSGGAGFSSPRPGTSFLCNEAGEGRPFGQNVILIMAVRTGIFGTSGSGFISSLLDLPDEMFIGMR